MKTKIHVPVSTKDVTTKFNNTKKSFLMATAIALCGTALTLSSCNINDAVDEIVDQMLEGAEDRAARAEATYMVDLGANTLELAKVKVIYVDGNHEEKSEYMTSNHWELRRKVKASEMPADFMLKVVFEERPDASIDMNKDYEFGCVSRIPFVVYNSRGFIIASHPGAVAVTDGKHPVIRGDQVSGWWLAYEMGINPDKLINFDKKNLSIREDRAVLNKWTYKYPYPN